MFAIRSLSIGIINYRQLSSLSANSHLALFQNSTLLHGTMTQRNLYPYRNQGAFALINVGSERCRPKYMFAPSDLAIQRLLVFRLSGPLLIMLINEDPGRSIST